MSCTMLTLNGLTFQYPEAIEPLFHNLNLTFSHGWTGVAGANGTGKSTLLRLIAKQLRPQSGSISGPENPLYCEQQNPRPPENMESYYQEFYSGDNEAGKLFSLLRLDHDWPYRWDTLSYGERKRAQLAVALWKEPEVLALDEPTNHLDQDAVTLIQNALSLYKGIGLIISHDRQLLDSLCQRTLILGAEQPRMFNCSWSQAQEALEQENQARRSHWEELKKQEKKLKKELQRRREEEDRHRKDFSKKHIHPGDKDAKTRIDMMRVSGKDSIGGQLVKQMESRVLQTGKQLHSVSFTASHKQGVTITGSVSRRNRLLYLEEGSLVLGEGRALHFPPLLIRGEDRVSLTGRNGSGKTSLIRYLLSKNSLPSENYLYLPQEIPETEKHQLLEQFHSLSTDEQGEILSTYSRLNGNPPVLLGSTDPSPGELRKLSIAKALCGSVELLILDEPTNHLDLPSRLALEEALSHFPGCILLVSHDTSFREKICPVQWHIDDNERLGIIL